MLQLGHGVDWGWMPAIQVSAAGEPDRLPRRRHGYVAAGTIRGALVSTDSRAFRIHLDEVTELWLSGERGVVRGKSGHPPRVSEPIDVEKAAELLEEASSLLRASALEYCYMAAFARGPYVALADRLMEFAHGELDDARRLTEKLIGLGIDAGSAVAVPRRPTTVAEGLRSLAATERESMEVLVSIIPATGTGADSEALEHLIEHILLRKQTRVELIERALAIDS